LIKIDKKKIIASLHCILVMDSVLEKYDERA